MLGEYNKLHGILYTYISNNFPIFLLTKLSNDLNDDVITQTKVYTDHTVALFKSIIDTKCLNDVYASEDQKKSYYIF